MGIYNLAWFVVVLPLLGALASFLAETQRRAAQICVAFSGLGFLLALIVLGVRLSHPQASFDGQITFFAMNPPEGTVFATRFEPFLGVHVNSLSASFGAAVAFVVLAVQAYSLTWFRGESSYRRFFWSSSLLAFAALGFVFSPNAFDSLVMWTAGSVAMYLTALHWVDRPDAAAPARRALVILKIGDVALLLGVIFAFLKFGTYASLLPAPAGQDINDPFSFTTIGQATTAVLHGVVGGAGPRTLAVLASLFIFAAVVRAAQGPFQVWLTELAAAPVPVLALGASLGGMAGGYLLARLYPILINVPHAPTALALTGAAAALFAAVVSLAQRDILRIGALVAVTQLGLVFAALGTGGYSQGMFVLFTSLFFDALFVLGAGNVIRVYRTRNLHETGGAWARMRISSIALGAWAAGVGGLSLNVYYTLSAAFANTNPSGGHLAGASRALLVALILAVALIVVVSAFRLVLTVCSGEVVRRRGFQHERVREVDRSLRRWTALALVAAAASVVVGLPGIQPVHSGKLSIPGLTFSHFVFFGASRPSLPVDGLALLLSLALLALGIAAAVLMYSPSRRAATAASTSRFAPAVHLVARVFLLERGAHRAGRPVVRAGELVASFDQRVVDSVTESLAEAPVVATVAVTRLRPQRPSLYLAGGLVVVGILALLSVLAATGHFWVHTT